MIEKKELSGILITVLTVKMLLVFPRELIVKSGQAAWINVIYISVIAFLLIFLTMRVYKEKKSVIELSEKVGGKGLRIVTGLIIFIIMLTNFSFTSRIFPETVKVVLLHETNIEIITVVFAIAVGLGAYFGINSLARVNYMFLPIAAAVLVAFLLLLIPYYDIDNIMPILGEGPKNLFLSGFNSISLFSDIIVINALLPSCKNMSEARWCTRVSVIVAGVVATVITLAYCLSYVYPASTEYILPVYQLARMIHISNFFSRFEAFFQFIWSILIFLYSAIYLYTMCNVLQATFYLKYLKPLIFPVALIAVTVSGIPSAITDTIEVERIIRMIEYPFALLLPLLFAALWDLKKSRLKRR